MEFKTSLVRPVNASSGITLVESELLIRLGQLSNRGRNQILLHILTGLNYVFQMLRREARAPGISQRPARFFAQLKQVRMHQRYSLRYFRIVTTKDKLHIHRVAMAQRDGCHHPLELNLPGAAEWIRTRFKLAETLHEDESVAL